MMPQSQRAALKVFIDLSNEDVVQLLCRRVFVVESRFIFRASEAKGARKCSVRTEIQNSARIGLSIRSCSKTSQVVQICAYFGGITNFLRLKPRASKSTAAMFI